MKESNLSDKIVSVKNYLPETYITLDGFWVARQDVRKFIRQELILIKRLEHQEITWSRFILERHKLIGSALTGSGEKGK